MLELRELKKRLHYNPDTGIFIWIKPSKHHSELLDKEAGTIQTSRGKSYRTIGIDGKVYLAHRLAWLFFYGWMPKQIDHKNGNSLDNPILNLREANNYQNTQNHTRTTKKNGLPTGVTMLGDKYRSRITAYKKVYYLGVFKTSKEASEAYLSARDELHDAPARGYLNV